MKAEYYDWTKTLSFDAPITMVITSRGKGKTYGIRRQFVNDWLKHNYRFVEIARQKNELSPLMDNYFERLGKEFPSYVFKCEQYRAYMAARPQGKKKPEWKLIGYFIAMSQFQLIKKKTYNRVKRILVDEAVMDKNDKFHHYMKNEWEVLTSIVDSVSRERADSEIKPRVYLLGNACDILNPYFAQAGISGDPDVGYTWHMRKNFLLHYEDDETYANEKRQTLAGIMGDNAGDSVSIDNRFDDKASGLIAKKSSEAQHLYTFLYEGKTISVWCDLTDGWYYITSKAPKDGRNTFALTLEDHPNHIILQRTSPLIKTLFEAYRLRCVKFDSIRMHGDFLDMLRYMGYR